MPDTPRAAIPNEGVALSPITLAEIPLPPAGTRRWVARRKAQVVEAIQSGQLTLDEAWRRYRLGVEEFGAWKRALFRAGVQGLRAAGPRAEALAGSGARRVSPSRRKDRG